MKLIENKTMTTSKSVHYDYVVIGETQNSSVGNGDCLTNDPNGGIIGVFDAPEDQSQDEYEQELIRIHVHDADGEFVHNELGLFYNHQGEWHYVYDDGELKYYGDDGPENPQDHNEVSKWVLKYSPEYSLPFNPHPTWLNHPHWQEIKKYVHSTTPFVPRDLFELFEDVDLREDNPNWVDDLSSRTLPNGNKIMTLCEAFRLGIVDFFKCEGKDYVYGSSNAICLCAISDRNQWIDIHVFGRRYGEFTNCCGADVNKTQDKAEPPDFKNLNYWHVVTDKNNKPVAIVYIFGVAYIGGGHYDTGMKGLGSLRIAAAIVGAGYYK